MSSDIRMYARPLRWVGRAGKLHRLDGLSMVK